MFGVAIRWCVTSPSLILYRGTDGERSRTRLYAVAFVASVRASCNLLQISRAFVGVKAAVVTVSVGLVCVGGYAGVQWWYGRNAATGERTTA